MLFEKDGLLNLLTCDACASNGYQGLLKCRVCKSMSVGYIERDGVCWYWGEPLTKYHINLRRARRFVGKMQVVGSLIFGLGFLTLFFWLAYQRELLAKLFTSSEFWLNGYPGNPITLFWFAVIAFSFFVYRLSVTDKKMEAIDWRKNNGLNQLANLAEKPILHSWQEVARFPRKKRKNISLSFTSESLQVLEVAYKLAAKNKNPEVTAQHLFSALLLTDKISGIFLRLGISAKMIQAKLAQVALPNTAKGFPVVSKEFQQILFQSYRRAMAEHQDFVNVTELLVATVRQSEVMQELLYDLNVNSEKLTNVVEWLRIRERLSQQYQKLNKAGVRRNKYGLDRAMTAVATPYLNSFSEDITMAAKFGYLSPCVGRDKELEEVFRIIEGGGQSIILVGDRGVGKMSIIEGIAQKMVEDDVPKRLQDKRLVQLSVSSLLAGTTVSGAQERLMNIMNEVGRARNIILFIKNIQDLISIKGSGEKEGMGVSETLSEYLGPGKFLTFATTTTDGYNRYIMNSEIGSVLSKVEVNETTENQAIQVLESKVGVVEYKNKVFFSYDALASSVKLAQKFLHDQNLPESAITLMSEAASFTRRKKGENSLVTEEEVALVISEKTGVPAASISEDESGKLMRLEEEMHKNVIGQNEAVSLVADALRRARAQVRSQKKPIANFLFLGPTGVGKTELAKTIANVYFGGEDKMIRIDMSEYQDKSGIYRLIGQPNQQGSGILTEAVRQNPFSLILLDEMEKADKDVLNLFLQVFDDGRLTDSIGKAIDFTNTIIIATSNAGTAAVQEQMKAGVEFDKIRQNLIHGDLKQYFRPEFLNRFDGIVLFRSLQREEIKQVAGLMLKRVAKDLETRGVELRVEATALEALANVGFDPEFGARPMRRAIQDMVENKLAELILSGSLKRRDIVILDGQGLRVERN